MNKQTSMIRTRRINNAGFALLESMVAMLLFSVGVLGVVGLQANMTGAQSASKYRGDAIYLSSELVGVLRADTPNLAKYASADCGSHARCDDWSSKVIRTLPGGASVVAVNAATGAVTITITWAPPNEGTHRFSMTTAILA